MQEELLNLAKCLFNNVVIQIDHEQYPTIIMVEDTVLLVRYDSP